MSDTSLKSHMPVQLSAPFERFDASNQAERDFDQLIIQLIAAGGGAPVGIKPVGDPEEARFTFGSLTLARPPVLDEGEVIGNSLFARSDEGEDRSLFFHADILSPHISFFVPTACKGATGDPLFNGKPISLHTESSMQSPPAPPRLYYELSCGSSGVKMRLYEGENARIAGIRITFDR